MADVQTHFSMQSTTYTGHHNNAIAADVYTPLSSTILGVTILAHGGGQTRHSWQNTACELARHGWIAISIDQRGHGDSAWDSQGDYTFSIFAADLVQVADKVYKQYGYKPVCIGASLGGLASMLAAAEQQQHLEAIIMVDITPGMSSSGVEKILGFMAQNLEQGFASLDDAADTIARYLPHRPRPKNLDGLSKNLRLGDDGRYRWHWDPQFLLRKKTISKHDWQRTEQQLLQHAQQLRIPVLLVRGKQSELVSEQHVADFLKLVPHARFVDISDAGHMLAGDNNDLFSGAVVDFLKELKPSSQACG